jgi:hypothetical protein
MINDSQIGKDLEGSGHSLIATLSWPGETEENHENLRIASG